MIWSRPRLLTSLLATSLLAMAILAGQASAAAVTNTNDSGPGSLRLAVEVAVPGETITVPAGTYSLASELPVAKSLTIAGAGAATTTIRAAGLNYRLFQTTGASTEVTISGVTLRDVRQSLPGATILGGVILNEKARLTLDGVIITGNVLDVSGGSGVAGGVVLGGGVLSISGSPSLTIRNSSVSGNQTSSRGGEGKNGGVVEGAGFFANEGNLTVENSTFADNRADVGGGQGPSSIGQSGGVVVGVGAGVNNLTAASLRNVTFSGNTGVSPGGPGGGGGVTLGGGLYLTATTGAAALSQLTITGNSARDGASGTTLGGGLYLTSSSATVPVTSSTIVANAVEGAVALGGNVFGNGKATFANTIVAGGSAGAGSENCYEPAQSRGFNIDSLDQCGFHGAGDKVNTNPQLGPLAANGGPTATMLPALTSPAVDQGAGFGLSADQRGVIRPIDFPSIPNAPGGDGSDIGAVELQPSNAIVLGKLKKNKKKGTAKLTVFLPVPNVGTVTLGGKGLKPQSSSVAGTTPTLTLNVVPKSKAVKKALRKKGRRKIGLTVTYSPLGTPAATQTRKATLVKKHKRHAKKSAKPKRAP